MAYGRPVNLTIPSLFKGLPRPHDLTGSAHRAPELRPVIGKSIASDDRDFTLLVPEGVEPAQFLSAKHDEFRRRFG